MNPPLKRAKDLNSEKVKAFISGAESKNSSSTNETKVPTDTINSEPQLTEPEEGYPWENANEKVMKGVNLRLTEVQWAKLRYIVDNTPFSIQKFIMSLLEPAMEEYIKKIINSKKL